MKSIQPLCALVALLATFVSQSVAIRDSTFVQVREDSPESRDGFIYTWIIGEDEERRISALLEHDVGELDFLGFRMNAPPQQCGHCGKDTEVVDWVYTALNRGVHSKEWIVQAIREGTISRKAAHDIYCSRCGHLTRFQDHSGDEGLARHISEATLFDRVLHRFTKGEDSNFEPASDSEDSELKGEWRNGLWVQRKSTASNDLKRALEEVESRSTLEDDTSEGDLATLKSLGWGGNWIAKKATASDTSEGDSAALKSFAWAGGRWVAKKTTAPDTVKRALGELEAAGM